MRVRPEPVIVQSGTEHSVALLLASAEALARKLTGRGHRRVLVRSDMVVDVMCALLACESADCGLFIAHGFLPDTLIQQLARDRGITALLDRAQGDELQESSCVETKESLSAFRVFIMTSGTTGQPKIAEHNVEALISRVKSNRTTQIPRWLLTYPITTFAGLQVLLTSMLTGAVLIVPPDRNPLVLLETSLHYRVTHISGTPTFWRSFSLALESSQLLPNLCQITLGGEAVDQSTLDRLASKFPKARISHIYASTEAGALFSVHDGRSGFPAVWLEDGIEGIGLRIRGGVLEVQSPRQAIGYASNHRLPISNDGWLSTGDAVSLVGDRVAFKGRVDGRLNVGGYKVSPEEVESVLLEVEGVTEARVTGTPSPLTGQALVAEIVCTAQWDPDLVRARALRYAMSVLEPFKVPRVVRIVPAIRTEDSGKKDRKG